MRLHHIGRVARWYRRQGISLGRAVRLACWEMRVPRGDWMLVAAAVERRLAEYQ